MTGLNLEKLHKRYEGVLEILNEENCALAVAMKEYGVARNTIHDTLGICELKIVDPAKYHAVVTLACVADGLDRR